MRTLPALRYPYAVAAILALGFSAPVNAQEEAPLNPSATPPPDIQERERLGAKPPEPPGRSPEVDELLQKVRLTRADVERKKADKAERELPAANSEPPDVQEQKKADKAPAPPGRSPDVGELIDKIKQQPGGAERLEKARKGGAKIPPGKVGATLESGAVRMAGPRMDGPVYSDPGDEQVPVLKATRAAPYQSVAGLGSMSVGDFTPISSNTNPMWGGYYRIANPNHVLVGTLDVKPYMYASVNVATPGWYIVNFVATRGKASLKRYDSATSTYPSVTQWDNSASPNPYESYPYVVNLAAGSHYFYWIPEAGYFWVSEVSLMKL
jgi:hypothetical protein